jgi:uroporphyrinogen III methyltransferase/synthase
VVAGPLAGRTVIVTRARAQADALIEAFERLGARVLAAPAIEVVEPPDWRPCDTALDTFTAYDRVVFTSVNAFDRFVHRATVRQRDVMSGLVADGRPRVAAIGPATARRLREAGIPTATVAAEARAEGLIATLAAEGVAGERILLPRALEGREALPEGLRAAGAQVDVVPVYRVAGGAFDSAAVVAALRAGQVDAVTLLSGRTARAFVEALALAAEDRSAAFARVRPVVVGPVTAAAVAELGFATPIVAPVASAAGVVAAVVAAFEEDAP